MCVCVCMCDRVYVHVKFETNAFFFFFGEQYHLQIAQQSRRLMQENRQRSERGWKNGKGKKRNTKKKITIQND